MRFDLITIFPEFFAGPLEHGIVRRAREAGLIDVRVQDLREFTKDRHRTVDDRPFGGGEVPAMLVVDAVTRLLPGALGNEASSQNESFSAGSILPTGAQYIAPLQLSDEHRASDHQLAESNGLLDYPRSEEHTSELQ